MRAQSYTYAHKCTRDMDESHNHRSIIVRAMIHLLSTSFQDELPSGRTHWGWPTRSCRGYRHPRASSTYRVAKRTSPSGRAHLEETRGINHVSLDMYVHVRDKDTAWKIQQPRNRSKSENWSEDYAHRRTRFTIRVSTQPLISRQSTEKRASGRDCARRACAPARSFSIFFFS